MAFPQSPSEKLLALLNPLGENENYLPLLEEQLKGIGVIPFVGAGVSVPFGIPTWSNFLLKLAEKRGLADKIQERLTDGQFEEAAEDLLTEYGPRAFHDQIKAEFGNHKLVGKTFADDAVSSLPKFAVGPVFTTNFDQILEKVFKQARVDFERVVIGAKTDLIAGALSSEKRYLLKIHGDVEDRTDRILTYSEFEQHYGTSKTSVIDFTKPLPLHLRAMMQHRPLLFVGCSLSKNRVTEILRYISETIPGLAHYAIIAKPENFNEFRAKAKSLSDLGIRPIWYPSGRHDLIKPLLEYLAGFVKPILPEAKLINVPPKNEFFTGREEILTSLHDQLKTDNKAILKQAVFGLGGIGKTQTAIEYAHKQVTQYTYILWTRADDESAMISGFIGFAERLGLPPREKAIEYVEDVKNWLTLNSNWLLILDNADRPEIVSSFLPLKLNGKILLTSRAQNFSTLGAVLAIELDVMRPDEAIAFLKKRTGRAVLSPSEEKEALSLSDELGYLPLALEQAAAYIKEHNVLFRDFLTAIRPRLQEAMMRLQPVEGDYKESDREKKIRYTVATTWLLNFEQVEKESPPAADILRLSAFLAPDAIPLELIEDGSEHISPIVAEAIRKAFTVNELVTPLRRYSLISLDMEQKTYNIHRLVQVVTKDKILVEKQKKWRERAVFVLHSIFPKPEFQNWKSCERYLPHVLAMVQFIEEQPHNSQEISLLLNKAGGFLQHHGHYTKAEQLQSIALKLNEKTLGHQHPYVAVDFLNLAEIFQEQGKYSEAEELHKKALMIFEKALGEDHLELTPSLNNLAMIYFLKGQYEEAESFLKRALSILRKSFDDSHPRIIASLNNLASLFTTQRKYLEAESLLKEVIVLTEKSLGEYHPDTSTSLNNLAVLYLELEEPGKAEPLLRKALVIKERILGDKHPSVLAQMNNLAAAYNGQKKFVEAEELYRKILIIMENSLNKDHPNLATTLSNLAGLCRSQKNYLEAESLLLRALRIDKATFGEKHPNVCSSLNNLAGVYLDGGDYKKAEVFFRDALNLSVQLFGEFHQNTLIVMSNYVNCLRYKGDINQALQLEERIRVILKKLS